MLQCSICEDWYLSEDESSEVRSEDIDMICFNCWDKCKVFAILFQVRGQINSLDTICFQTIQQNAESLLSDASAFTLPLYDEMTCSVHWKTLLMETAREAARR